METASQTQLSRLREIGLGLWDPIGVEPVADSGAEDEYDRYLLQVLIKLRAGEPAHEVVEYLVRIETEDMSLGFSESAVSRATATVEAVFSYLKTLMAAQDPSAP